MISQVALVCSRFQDARMGASEESEVSVRAEFLGHLVPGASDQGKI